MDAATSKSRRVRRVELQGSRRSRRESVDVEKLRVPCQCKKCVALKIMWPGYFIGVLSVMQDRRVVERHAISFQCRQDMLMNNAPPGKVKGKRASDIDSDEAAAWAEKWGMSCAQTLGVVPRECELEPDGSGQDDPVALRVLMEHVRREGVTSLHLRGVRDFVLAAVLLEMRHHDPAMAVGDVEWKLRHTLALLKSSSRESTRSRSARVRCRYSSS